MKFYNFYLLFTNSLSFFIFLKFSVKTIPIVRYVYVMENNQMGEKQTKKQHQNIYLNRCHIKECGIV